MREMRCVPFLLLLLLLLLLPLCYAGCRQRMLCCRGRNNTCKAMDDGLGHIPASFHLPGARHDGDDIPHMEHGGMVFPEVWDSDSRQPVGHIVMPDVVELEGSGAGDLYRRYGADSRSTTQEPPGQLVRVLDGEGATRTPKHFMFGYPKNDREIEKIVHEKRHLLIRYSILSRHLPLIITHDSDDNTNPRLEYLEAPETECFCDEQCVILGDCCSDYTYVCPPQDCEVSEWQPWEACRPDKGRCGPGEQGRDRRILREAERGGAECPATRQMRTCHAACRKRHPDPTTVAHLLDYRHRYTRQKKRNNEPHRKEIEEKKKELQYYCVKYEIGWVNRNCVDTRITGMLHRGATICAECQPEAQLHRNEPRCASDLEDGDSGFWKLVGPKSCNGIWRRIESFDNCQCGRDMNATSPFLFI